jgi:hypothetical protein
MKHATTVFSRRPSILAILAAGMVGAGAAGSDAALDRALAWIPEDSVSFVAVPSLKRLSDDIAQLAEATEQGGALALGRPVDILKAQLGVGANLDESGPVVAYYPPSALAVDPATAQALPVVVMPVTDAAAFLAANFKPRPEFGADAFESAQGAVFYAKSLEGRVALAPAREALPAADARGIGERFRARLRSDARADEAAWVARADLVAWGSREALRDSAARARRMPVPAADAAAVPAGIGGFGADPETAERFRQKSLEVLDMLADGIVAIDVDPLGLFVASVGVADPASKLAAITAGGAGSAARFDRLPLRRDFYVAFSADLDGLGGAARFGELLDLGGARASIPEWVLADGADVAAVQFAAYPSKLGVAIGGALNDSAFFVRSRNPAGTLARLRAAVEATAGESAGIRREPSWNDAKELKGGAVAAAFEVKETVLDAAKRPVLDIERVAKQFVVGSAGLKGLARKTPDGVVVVFSQRPDVFGRAVEAAGGGKTLATDETVRSIEEWLPAQPDVEAMVGVGPLVALVGQIASSFVDEEQVKASLPRIDRDAEPVAFALEVGEGRVRGTVVVPAAVLKAAAQAGVRGAATAVPAPAPAVEGAPR